MHVQKWILLKAEKYNKDCQEWELSDSSKKNIPQFDIF